MTDGGKSTVVSIKTSVVAGQKRKADENRAQGADREKKKNRRSINKKVKH